MSTPKNITEQQDFLKNEIEIAHFHRVNVIKEALLLKTVNLIAEDAPLEKIEKMIKILDSTASKK